MRMATDGSHLPTTSGKQSTRTTPGRPVAAMAVRRAHCTASTPLVVTVIDLGLPGIMPANRSHSRADSRGIVTWFTALAEVDPRKWQSADTSCG